MLQLGWKVIEFFPYERFKELYKFAIKLNQGDEQRNVLRNELVDNALENGIKAYGDNKTAFMLQGEDGRKLMVGFYDCATYIIPQ